MISQAASKVGFAGGIVIDYPNSSKAKKYYLCLSFERSYRVPVGLTGDGLGEQSVPMVQRERSHRISRKIEPAAKGSVDWIVKKKERMKRMGKVVKSDSKFTGRKRKAGF